MAGGGGGSEEAGAGPAASGPQGYTSRARPSRLAEAVLRAAGDAGSRVRRGAVPLAPRPAGWPPAAGQARGAAPAARRLAMDLRMLSRELSLYLEHQVRVGFFGSGVCLSLILGFSVAYACYYLSSIAKVSQGAARARARRATGGFSGSDGIGRSRRLVAGGSESLGKSWGEQAAP